MHFAPDHATGSRLRPISLVLYTLCCQLIRFPVIDALCRLRMNISVTLEVEFNSKLNGFELGVAHPFQIR